MKIKMIATGAALATAMSVGVVGMAGAATPSSNQARPHAGVERIEAIANAGALPANFNCATASTKLAHIATAESKVNAHIATAQTREQAPTAAGNTARATEIAGRITKAQTFVSDLGTVSSLISAACPS